MRKEDKSLKEGLGKTFEKKDDNSWMFCFASRMFIMGCSPFGASLSWRFFGLF
jgi:hypothetical protein